MRLKETMIKRLFNLYDDIFNKLKLEIYIDELGTIYGKWFDKNEKLIFSRNHFGTLWVDDCDSYTTLWIYSKALSLNKEEFELSLIDYLNLKYQNQSKNRPIKSIGDEKHCLEEMEYETENLQETIKRILREELDNNSLSTYVRRRLHSLNELIDVILSNSNPCDYPNEEYFMEGILYDLETYLMTFELEGLTSEEVLPFVKKHYHSEIRRYYINSQEDC